MQIFQNPERASKVGEVERMEIHRVGFGAPWAILERCCRPWPFWPAGIPPIRQYPCTRSSAVALTLSLVLVPGLLGSIFIFPAGTFPLCYIVLLFTVSLGSGCNAATLPMYSTIPNPLFPMGNRTYILRDPFEYQQLFF